MASVSNMGRSAGALLQGLSTRLATPMGEACTLESITVFLYNTFCPAGLHGNLCWYLLLLIYR